MKYYRKVAIKIDSRSVAKAIQMEREAEGRREEGNEESLSYHIKLFNAQQNRLSFGRALNAIVSRFMQH
jgi:hypothetical protein